MAKLLSFMKSAVIFSLIFFAQMVVAAEFPPAPNSFHYINDYTNTLSAEHKQILENKLIAYSKETSSQIAVVLVPTTGEYEIADYTFALGDKWGIDVYKRQQVSIAAFTSCEKSYSPRHFCTLLRKRSTSAVNLTCVL